ncbi:MAG: hypothetical protein IVW54_08185 [Candidatus Binataceae bacterium]|nr:hypothetical protein [Candidatus Binataceae bacterium]
MAVALAIPAFSCSIAHAVQLKTLGRLSIPATTQVIPICTDAVMQEVLTQDFGSARSHAGSTPPITITVTMHQHVMTPGISAQAVAPGDPIASDLLEALGAPPMPLGDTGDQPSDPYEAAARLQALEPEDPMMQQMRQYQATENAMSGMTMMGTMGGGVALGRNDPGKQYPTAIVARVTSSGRDGSLTVAALLNPGENVRDAKELIAEEIANHILH